MLKRGLRVLVCGPSNISVDNIVERLVSRCVLLSVLNSLYLRVSEEAFFFLGVLLLKKVTQKGLRKGRTLFSSYYLMTMRTQFASDLLPTRLLTLIPSGDIMHAFGFSPLKI